MVGPGGYEIRLSPGSEVYDLLDSEAGHQMLPCSQFAKGRKPSQDSFTFLVGTHFEKTDSAPSGGDSSSTGAITVRHLPAEAESQEEELEDASSRS